MSLGDCPWCGRVRGAHRQVEFCSECYYEGCTSCMPQGYCATCAAIEAEQVHQLTRDAIAASKARAKS